MILNIPTHEAMIETSLSLYFFAWQNLMDLLNDFVRNYPDENLPLHKDYSWADEWIEYEQSAQRNLQSIITLLQQANEIGLKSRLCAVSPFLLILGQGHKYSTTIEDIEFSLLRTIQAVDLPGAVNKLTDTPVSAEFITAFNDLRQTRNRIMHSGVIESSEGIFPLLHSMVATYFELWPDRAWLCDRVQFGGSNSLGYFDDGRYFSVISMTMYEWGQVSKILTDGEFKRLFDISKTKRRYVCFECLEDGRTKWSDYVPSEVSFAHLKNKNTLTCLMCCEDFDVTRTSCPVDDCAGNVLAGQSEKFPNRCHTCTESS